MNSNRPSKPNLHSVPSFLLQRGCVKPISFQASRIPLLDHSINQCKIGSFLTTSQSTKQPSHRNGYGKKGFGNKPLKDLTMERKRVKEFEESLNEDWG